MIYGLINYLALSPMLTGSLHAWAPIPTLKTFSTKMSLINFVRVTINVGTLVSNQRAQMLQLTVSRFCGLFMVNICWQSTE